MILGLGTDIVEVSRVKKALEKHKDKFLKKIFTQEETLYCFSLKDPYPSFAARFAAKEAFAKAIKTGFGRHLRFQDISISRSVSGAPYIVLISRIEKTYPGIFHLSLSHTKEIAVASVIWEQKQSSD